MTRFEILLIGCMVLVTACTHNGTWPVLQRSTENQELWVLWRETPTQEDHNGSQEILKIVGDHPGQPEDERVIGRLQAGFVRYGFEKALAQTLAYAYMRKGEPILAEAALFGGEYRGENLTASMPSSNGMAPKPVLTTSYSKNIDDAASYFKARGAYTQPSVGILFDYLGRKFGLNWQGPMIEGYLLGARNDYYLATLMRILDPQAVAPFEFDSDARAQVMFPALYCDQRPISPSFYARVFWDSVRGGYDLTHAVLALEWARENGCITGEREWAALREEQIRRMLAETEREAGDDDLFFERLAFLFYVGAGEWVKPDWVERVAKAQRTDGGWGQVLGEDSNDHASFLAFWVLLEAENPDAPDTPMIHYNTW